jgi:lysyl-tRNA synthetase class II
MPPAAGMALGIERLLMWLSGTQDIREVLAFAWGER